MLVLTSIIMLVLSHGIGWQWVFQWQDVSILSILLTQIQCIHNVVCLDEFPSPSIKPRPSTCSNNSSLSLWKATWSPIFYSNNCNSIKESCQWDVFKEVGRHRVIQTWRRCPLLEMRGVCVDIQRMRSYHLIGEQDYAPCIKD